MAKTTGGKRSIGKGSDGADRQGHEGQHCIFIFREVVVRRVASWQETHCCRHRQGCAGTDGSRITGRREVRIAYGGQAVGEAGKCE